ncbi:MAG TPA: LPS export ABC transporter periplasmic protein LptC [Xanthomonadaceae bacterium]|nr:LPS export ABC transporter periplasmic protein LptC [Xanthomonadaceae bacterium]
MNWRLGLTLLLLAGAIVTGWSVLRQRDQGVPAASGGGRSDYVLHDFELIALDDDGSESFTLRAPLLQETPGARTMELTTPLFLLPDEDGRYWQVRARRGWISEQRDRIRLREDVRLDSPPGEDPTAMRTEELNVFPEKRLATSELAVTVTEPGLTMIGRGLRAELDAKRFTLLSQARTLYVPSSR